MLNWFIVALLCLRQRGEIVAQQSRCKTAAYTSIQSLTSIFPRQKIASGWFSIFRNVLHARRPLQLNREFAERDKIVNLLRPIAKSGDRKVMKKEKRFGIRNHSFNNSTAHSRRWSDSWLCNYHRRSPSMLSISSAYSSVRREMCIANINFLMIALCGVVACLTRESFNTIIISSRNILIFPRRLRVALSELT